MSQSFRVTVLFVGSDFRTPIERLSLQFVLMRLAATFEGGWCVRNTHLSYSLPFHCDPLKFLFHILDSLN